MRQDHQSVLDSLSRLRCCRDNQIDISGRTLIAMSGKRVAADQQVISTVLMERSQ